jgi:hypothetical protein
MAFIDELLKASDILVPFSLKHVLKKKVALKD